MPMKNTIKISLLILFFSISYNLGAGQSNMAGTKMSKKEFLNKAFTGTQAEAKQKTIWLKDDLQSKIIDILDRPYAKLRLRYWINKEEKQSVWFLDEIGKERPISFAVSIINRHISLIKVLAFRESRGGEIQMLSFTEQFKDIGLNNENKLDQHVDGISGATMSVSAMKKISRLALMLDREVLP